MRDGGGLSRRSRAVAILLAVVAIAATVLIAVAADRGTLPPALERIHAFPGGDKVGHLGIYGTLAVLLELGVEGRTRRLAGASVSAGGLWVALAATLEEVSQVLYPATRTPSLLDLGAGLAGIALGVAAARRILRARVVCSMARARA